MYEDTSAAEVTELDGFDEGWDDIPAAEDSDTEDLSRDETEDVSESASTETDVETETDSDSEDSSRDETAAQDGEGAGESETKSETQTADQQFELKHLGELKTVSRDEVITLAQKGMDYDRIRTERDAAKEEASRLAEYEAFLKELAGSGTPQDLMDTVRAEKLARTEGIDKSVALQRVKLQRERQSLEADRQKLSQQQQKATDEAAEQDRRRQEFISFTKEHPDVNATDIPRSVWEDVAAGKTLSDAYSKYEVSQLREKIRELETRALNEKNRERAAGSRQSAGKTRERDPFDEGWDSI